MRHILHTKFDARQNIPNTMKALTSKDMLDRVHGKGKWESTPWVDGTRSIAVFPSNVPRIVGFAPGPYYVRQIRSRTTLLESCTAYGVVRIEAKTEVSDADVEITVVLITPVLTPLIKKWMLTSAKNALDAMKSV